MPHLSSRRQFFRAAALTGVAAAAGAGFKPAALAAGASAPEPAAGGGEPLVPLAPPDKQPPKLPIPEGPARKVGWAIVGLGELALDQILPAFRDSQLSAPVALVSGHPEKAKQVGQIFGLHPSALYSYENFDSIAQNPAIEVVYIVLPNSMHAEYTVRALRAGKHVLCEKPMASKIEDAEKMVAASTETGKKLMIAYRLHYEPMTLTAKALIQQQAYGLPRVLSSSNNQFTPAPNIRLSKELGGGPLGDIGIYSINTARMLLNEDPIEVSATAFQDSVDPRFREVPESVVFTLRFPSGVLASCDCSFSSTESRRWRLCCEKGWVEMDPAFSYKGLRLRVKDGSAKEGGGRQTELLVEEKNQFALEMDHFSQCVLTGEEPRTPGQEGLTDLHIIAALNESIATGRVVTVAPVRG